MSFRRKKLASQAAAAALRLRVENKADIRLPVCVYDLAEKIGLNVLFIDNPSLEEMIANSPSTTILVSSLRPAGRRAYTCAHEIGHWKLGHGARIHEFVANRGGSEAADPEEWSAQVFAGALLMPAPAIQLAFHTRGWDIATCSAEQAHRIAGLFGVGYSTLVQHLTFGLGYVEKGHAETLLRVSLPKLRSSLAGGIQNGNVLVADREWPKISIDVEVGDVIISPPDTYAEGGYLSAIPTLSEFTAFRADSPGLGRLTDKAGWHRFYRVSRRNFAGRGIYRHLEDEQDE